MLCAYTWPRYQVSVYKTIGPLVFGNFQKICASPPLKHTLWVKINLTSVEKEVELMDWLKFESKDLYNSDSEIDQEDLNLT